MLFLLELKPQSVAVEPSRNQPATYCFHNFDSNCTNPHFSIKTPQGRRSRIWSQTALLGNQFRVIYASSVR